MSSETPARNDSSLDEFRKEDARFCGRVRWIRSTDDEDRRSMSLSWSGAGKVEALLSGIRIRLYGGMWLLCSRYRCWYSLSWCESSGLYCSVCGSLSLKDVFKLLLADWKVAD